MLFLFLQKSQPMLEFLNKLFGLKKETPKDIMKKYLIVGLGNIGPEYMNTRHNVGFQILDHLAKKEDLTFESKRLGDVATYKIKGRTLILLKPSTFMNLSGKSVLYWMNKEKINLENLMIITDDLNLPFGELRLKTKGSDGGHNGLKDIQEKLMTTTYIRFRFGISDAYQKGQQVNYVLSEWSEEERIKLEERFDKSCELLKSFVLAGVSITMNTFNGK